MKKNTHPATSDVTVSCVCGMSMQIVSTGKDVQLGICYNCHPFYTGQQKFVDTAGRIEKFKAKFGENTDYSKKR